MDVKLILPCLLLVIGKTTKTLSAGELFTSCSRMIIFIITACNYIVEPCYSSDYEHARVNESIGAVQLCVFQFGQGNIWQYVTTEGWTNKAAKVVCRELGYTVYSSKCITVQQVILEGQLFFLFHILL